MQGVWSLVRELDPTGNNFAARPQQRLGTAKFFFKNEDSVSVYFLHLCCLYFLLCPRIKNILKASSIGKYYCQDIRNLSSKLGNFWDWNSIIYYYARERGVNQRLPQAGPYKRSHNITHKTISILKAGIGFAYFCTSAPIAALYM